MEVPQIDWSEQLRGVSLEGPVLAEDDLTWDTHWKMNLLIMAKSQDAVDIAIALCPVAFLFRVEGSMKIPEAWPPAQATTGDNCDPNGGPKETATGPVDAWFHFNYLEVPRPGTYTYRVWFAPYGTQDSAEFVVYG